MSTTVRFIEERDHARWLDLFQAYIAFYRTVVPMSVMEEAWQRLIGRSDGLFGLVAVDERDQAIGLAHALMHRSTWSPTWYCYLEDLFVDPVRRGTGAGRALIDAVYREADARGCTRTYWVTECSNTTARALYDRVATRAPFVQYRR